MYHDRKKLLRIKFWLRFLSWFYLVSSLMTLSSVMISSIWGRTFLPLSGFRPAWLEWGIFASGLGSSVLFPAVMSLLMQGLASSIEFLLAYHRTLTERNGDR